MIKLKKTGAALAICASALIAVASLSGCGDTGDSGRRHCGSSVSADESEATRRPVQSARPSAAETTKRSQGEARSRQIQSRRRDPERPRSNRKIAWKRRPRFPRRVLSWTRECTTDAEEMLSYVNTDELSAEEMDEYNAIRAELDSAAANAGSDAADELTAEEAISIVRELLRSSDKRRSGRPDGAERRRRLELLRAFRRGPERERKNNRTRTYGRERYRGIRQPIAVG